MDFKTRNDFGHREAAVQLGCKKGIEAAWISCISTLIRLQKGGFRYLVVHTFYFIID